MTKRLRNTLVLAPLLAAGFLLAGCFQTKLSLGSGDNATVDVQYCGEWHFTWKEEDQSRSATLLVLGFDAKRYYAEWKQNDETIRFSAFLAPVQQATFVQLTPLGSDKDDSDTHIIARVQLDGKKLILRHLEEDFFEGITTDEALRQKIEQNVENDKMYAATLSGALISQP